MKKISYSVFFLLIIGFLIVSFWVYTRYLKKEPPSLLTFTVQRGEILETVRARGEIVSQKEFDLAFSFAGTVETIYVKEGDDVQEGKPLIKLETTDFDIELMRLGALLDKSRANLAKLQKGATSEELSLARTKVLSAEKTLSDAQANLNSIKSLIVANKRSYEDALNNANKNNTNVEKQAESDFKNKYTEAVNIINDAFIKYEHALNGPIDGLFEQLGNKAGQLIFSTSDSKAKQKAESLRTELKLDIDSFKNMLDTLPFDYNEIDKALISTYDKLSKVKEFLLNLHKSVTNRIDAFDKTTALADINTSLSAIETALASINTQKQAIINQQITNINRITTAQTKVDNAQNALNQQNKVDKNNLVSAESEINNALNALDVAKDELSLIEAGTRVENINIARAQEREIKSQMAGIREKIKKSTLYAPTDIRVDKILTEKSELLVAGQIAISLSADGHKIQADVSELEIGKIREQNGNEISVILDAFPDTVLNGKVVLIEPQEIEKDGDKYYRVNFFVKPHGLKIRRGMSADIVIYVANKKNVLKIPEFVIDKRDGKQYVTIIEGTEKIIQEIETGVSDGEFIEVTKGLSEDQEVAIVVD